MMYALAIQSIQDMLNVSILSFSLSSSLSVRRFVVYEHLPFAESHTKIIYHFCLVLLLELLLLMVVVADGGEYPYSWQ